MLELKKWNLIDIERGSIEKGFANRPANRSDNSFACLPGFCIPAKHKDFNPSFNPSLNPSINSPFNPPRGFVNKSE